LSGAVADPTGRENAGPGIPGIPREALIGIVVMLPLPAMTHAAGPSKNAAWEAAPAAATVVKGPRTLREPFKDFVF